MYLRLGLVLQLKLRQVTPPYKPRIDSDRDPSNFDPQFVIEPTEFTPDDPYVGPIALYK